MITRHEIEVVRDMLVGHFGYLHFSWVTLPASGSP